MIKPCACLQVLQSGDDAPPVRQSSFSAFHSELPLRAKTASKLSFWAVRSLINKSLDLHCVRLVLAWLVLVSQDAPASHQGAGCRSFRRAAAPCGSLDYEVVDLLLEVLCNGVLYALD